MGGREGCAPPMRSMENTTISILKNAQNNHIYNIWDCKLNAHEAIEIHWKHVFNHPFHCNVLCNCGPG